MNERLLNTSATNKHDTQRKMQFIQEKAQFLCQENSQQISQCLTVRKLVLRTEIGKQKFFPVFLLLICNISFVNRGCCLGAIKLIWT